MNDWAIDAKKHLRDQNLIQLFSEAVFIDPHNYTQRSERNGSFYVPGLLSRSGAKDLISVGSTIEKKVVSDGIGSGDSLMAAAMLGQHESISRRHSFSEDRRRHYFRRALPNRGYVDRQKGLTSFDFDPDIDRRIGSKRRMGLGKTEPDLELFTRKHVMSRAEDG